MSSNNFLEMERQTGTPSTVPFKNQNQIKSNPKDPNFVSVTLNVSIVTSIYLIVTKNLKAIIS